MTYYNETEKYPVDSKGVEIKPGDVIKSTDPNASLPLFVCYQHEGSGIIEIRDLNANNVCMCGRDITNTLTGLNGEPLVNLGSFIDNLDILNDYDCRYYFEISKKYAEELRDLRKKVKELSAPKEL